MDSPGKILSIDDEELLRASIVAFLEDSGYDVIEAANGQEGLEVFRAEKPDLVLSDLQMPIMGGLELLKIINEESPDTPVIVVSGAGVMDDAIEALRLGASDYLIKPIVDLEVLEHTVNRNLEKKRLLEENKKIRKEVELTNLKLTQSLAILEEDQVAGYNVQKRLFPEKQFIFQDCEISYNVTPSLYLSGDFIDYFEINNKLYFYLADISGHGSSAAFITMLVKNQMDKIVDEALNNKQSILNRPNKVLSYISNEIYYAKLGKYLTMIFGIYCPEGEVITYSIGGHYPNPILCNNNSANFLEGKNFPVGVMENVQYENYTTPFKSNDSFISFSDGIFEIIDGDFDEKSHYLLNYLKNNHPNNAPKIVNDFKIENLVERPDDISTFIIHRK